MAEPTPRLLVADNFTPRAKTPWGGTRLSQHFKRHVIDPTLLGSVAGTEVGTEVGTVVGESWELSVGDELPSRDVNGVDLRALIAEQPAAWLGAEASAGTTALLLKWLDTADDLSVQIHPADNHPLLGPEQTGKTEAWLVLAAEPGARLYLGLQDHVTEPRLREALTRGDAITELLRAWPVQPGEFFLVEPGTPHAIGRGVTLLEPQTATAGKRPVTYRYWDWHRRYDALGHLDPAGTPRTLHVDEALSVTRWPVNLRAPEPPHVRLAPAAVHGPAHLELICGPHGAPCASDRLHVSRVYGNGTLELPASSVLRAVTVVEGTLCLRWGTGEQQQLQIVAGHTAAVPACTPTLQADLTRAHAVISAVVS